MRYLNFIATNDIHWQLSNPRSRKDSYPEALKKKLLEISDLARKHEASGVLIAGDIVNSPGIGLVAIAELGGLFLSFPCPIYAIAGQHDEWDHTPTSLPRTPFGILSRLGIIRDVAKNPKILKVEGTDTDVTITGRHYDYRVDNDPDYYMSDYSYPAFNIHLAHGMILDHSPGFEMKHTLVSQVKTNANILHVGDYHPGIGIKKYVANGKGRAIVNLGALARKEASAGELERQVQVALIRVYENKSFDIDAIPLQSALPGHTVLSREHLEAEASRNEMLERFLALLSSEGESKFLEVREIIEDIALREAIPAEVKADALRRIGAAREELGVG